MLRALVASLCAMAMFSVVAAVPAARASRPAPVLPHVSLATMVQLTLAGELLALKDSPRPTSQGALAAGVPGSLPLAAGSQHSGLVTAAAATPASTCATSARSKLLAGGYSTKLLGLTTSGGESAVLKQITADCTAKKPVDQVAVTSLFKAKKPAVDASNFMFWGWFTPAGPASKTLKAAGYGPSPIGLSMKFTYDMKQQPTAQVLKDLGFSATQDMQALKDVFSLAAGPNSQIQKNIGYAATPNMLALKTVYKTDAPGSSKILKTDGYGATDNMRALKDVFASTAGPASKIIANDGYTSKQNGQALVDVFSTKSLDGARFLTADGYSAYDIGLALRDAFKVDASRMATLIKANGFSSDETATNLRDLYTKNGPDAAVILAQVGYDAAAIGSSMKTVFTLSKSQNVGALKGAGFIQTKIAQVVKPLYGITVPSDLAVAMLGGPFGSCDVAKGVAAVFTLSGADMTTALKAAFPAANDVTAGLSCVMPGFNAAYAAQLLAGAGYPIGDTVPAIRLVLNPDATTTTGAVRPFYPVINDVADTIKSSFVLGNPDLTKTMKDGGYGAPDLGGLLHDHFGLSAPDGVDLFSFAGFGGVPTADVLKNKFGIADPADALSLLKSKFNPLDIAQGLKDPYGITEAKKMAELFFDNFDPEAIANALGQVYSLALPDTVKAMFDAHYPIGLVSQAIDKYSTPPSFDDIPGLLRDAGFPIPDIGKTIHDYFNKPADVAAGFMKQFGAGADVIAGVLNGDYHLNGKDAALLLANLAFPMGVLTPILGSVFGVTADALSGVLEFAGFDPDDISDFIDSLGDTIDDVTCALDPFC